MERRNKNKSSKRPTKRKKNNTSTNASKVLFIIGNTLLIRDYVLNELKSNHNLII